ncbi:unnamed protein product [Medioppia subpectinata]|uniref:GAF domain-containing protein n=1 Tax=Medioppia subpectinata TaxID=1979941 RepID=A0A7R9L217_9ACAR|nr:unnamed protein product [Medioppia subpectinata]CAG2114115.1 unnamed protein product [Medioppia subpectinata]
MLCNPILDIYGGVMGVAQVINKTGTPCFTEKDENVFEQYLQFCGIGLKNADLYERSQLENKRNQVLLDLARMVFEKQSNIENIIYRILLHIQSLLQCSRCQVLLLAENSQENDINEGNDNELECKSNTNQTKESQLNMKNQSFCSFSRVFDLEAEDLGGSDECETRLSPFEGRFPINIGITGFVATSGQTLNIADAYEDPRFDPSVDNDNHKAFRTKQILCMPIRNAEHHIIGVSQLINKLNERPFNKNDENLFEWQFSILGTCHNKLKGK